MTETRKVRVTAAGEVHRLEVSTTGAVTADGVAGPIEVARIGPGTYRVVVNGLSRTVHVAGDLDRPWAFTDGQTFELGLALGEGHMPASSLPRHAAPLAAPMPATVSRILVAPDQAVKRGDTLILLDAMKMELAIKAPRDGTIEGIDCAEGDLVEPGVPLVGLKDEV